MGFWSKLFGGKEEKATTRYKPMKEDWQMALGTQLSDVAKRYLPFYQPGAGYSRLSQLMTPSIYEQQGLGELQKYIGGDIEPTGVMGQAKDVLSKTLAGEYDPFESKYYQSLRERAEKERKRSIKDLNIMLGEAGLGGTSYRAGRMQDIEMESLDKVSDLLAAFQEMERQEQLKAVTTAMELSGETERQAQNRLSTIMNIGQLPRLLENIGYQDFLRKQGELAEIPSLAERLFQYNIPYEKIIDIEPAKASGISKVIDYAKLALPLVAAPFTHGTSLGAYAIPGYMTPSSGSSDVGRFMQSISGIGDIAGAWGTIFPGKGTGGLNQGSRLSDITLKQNQYPDWLPPGYRDKGWSPEYDYINPDDLDLYLNPHYIPLR